MPSWTLKLFAVVVSNITYDTPRTPSPDALSPPRAPLGDFYPLLADTDRITVDIGRDIVLLTALLKDVQHGESTVSNTRRNGDLDLWSSILFILATGSSEDPYGN